MGFSQYLKAGNKTVTAAGTPEALSPTSVPAFKIAISALPTNTGNVYVGDENVDATAPQKGVRVAAAFPPLILEIGDLSQVYIDAAVNGEGVSFTYITNEQ